MATMKERAIMRERGEGTKWREQDRKDLLPSEKWGVLTREDIDEMAALIAGLHDWTCRLVWLCEELNNRMTLHPVPPPTSKMGDKGARRDHPNQVPLWDGMEVE